MQVVFTNRQRHNPLSGISTHTLPNLKQTETDFTHYPISGKRISDFRFLINMKLYLTPTTGFRRSHRRGHRGRGGLAGKRVPACLSD